MKSSLSSGKRSQLAGSTWRMLPPGLCTIPWAHSLSSDVPYSFSVCVPRLLHPAFSDGQGVPPCLYEPLPTLLETLLSAWSPHIAACLSALTGICSMPDNYFHPRNRGRAYHSCSMYSQTGRKSYCIFSYCSYSKFFSTKQSYPNTNVSLLASPYRKSSKLVNED